MNTRTIATSLVLLLSSSLVLPFVSAPGGARAAGALAAGESASVSDYMIVVNGRGGLIAQLGDALKETPESDRAWKAVAAKARIARQLTESLLSKAKPNKGSEDSWSKFVGEFGSNLQTLVAASQKKDADAAQQSIGVLKKSCSGCHKAHK